MLGLLLENVQHKNTRHTHFAPWKKMEKTSPESQLCFPKEFLVSHVKPRRQEGVRKKSITAFLLEYDTSGGDRRKTGWNKNHAVLLSRRT